MFLDSYVLLMRIEVECASSLEFLNPHKSLHIHLSKIPKPVNQTFFRIVLSDRKECSLADFMHQLLPFYIHLVSMSQEQANEFKAIN